MRLAFLLCRPTQTRGTPLPRHTVPILGVRTRLLAIHHLVSPYTTAAQIRDRIAQLHDAERLKEAA